MRAEAFPARNMSFVWGTSKYSKPDEPVKNYFQPIDYVADTSIEPETS